jgi:nitrogen fixation/metabolism regulation signal transduction histidine kinase
LLTLLDLFGKALLRVAHGDFLYRIRLVRRDELGRLFATFNLMNSALHEREGEPGKASRQGTAERIDQPTRIMPAVRAEDDTTPPK